MPRLPSHPPVAVREHGGSMSAFEPGQCPDGPARAASSSLARMSAVCGGRPLLPCNDGPARVGRSQERALDGSGSVTRLLMRFTVAGIVVMVLLAIGIAVVARMEAVQKGIDEARHTTWVVALRDNSRRSSRELRPGTRSPSRRWTMRCTGSCSGSRWCG